MIKSLTLLLRLNNFIIAMLQIHKITVIKMKLNKIKSNEISGISLLAYLYLIYLLSRLRNIKIIYSHCGNPS